MARPIVFISYNRTDEKEKDQLLSHLGVLQRQNLVDLWSDDRIGAGADWQTEIGHAIAEARVAILLVSANFLNSDFILNEQIPALLQRQESEGLVIFPVIAKACAWRAVGWLNRMGVRPKDGQPIWHGNDGHVDDKLASIAEEVAAIVAIEGRTIETGPRPVKGGDVFEESEIASLTGQQEGIQPLPEKTTLRDYLSDPVWQGLTALITIAAFGFAVYSFNFGFALTFSPNPTQDTLPDNGSSTITSADPICEGGIAPALEELDDMIPVTATKFIMGDNRGERPKHEVDVEAYLIDRFEVTNRQYQDFLSATGRPPPPEWDDLNFPPGQTVFQPVVNVTWFDARDYCTWAGKRLPTEAEWELACRGSDGRLYPWGQELDFHKANTQDNACGKPLTVGSFSPDGDSVYGAADMVGNVFEWVNSIYQPYPYLNDEREESSNSEPERVYRGGSWQTEQTDVGCTVRGSSPSEAYLEDRGFRCAKSDSSGQ